MALPFLVKLLGALLMGAAGVTFLQHPELATTARPSVGIVLVEHLTGPPTSGTAFVAGDHLVLTANHVIQGAGRVRLRFPGSEWVEAKVVESDIVNDVAVLSYDGPTISWLPLGNLAEVKPGDRVLVIAFPGVEELARDQSAKKPAAQETSENETQAQATAVEGTVRAIRGGLLLVSTPDIPRNGGPVLNLKGEVVGIVRGQLKVTEQGIGYATPSNAVKPALTAAELKRPSEPAPPGPTTAEAASGSTSASSLPGASEPVQRGAPAPSQSAASAPSQPAAQAPGQSSSSSSPSPPASAVAPQPASSAAVAAAPFLIVPGQSVGPVRLGMPIRDEIVQLGPSKGAAEFEDGTTMYRWFEPPSNAGIGVRTTQAGLVLRAWVLNDERYSTKDGLHVGSTEAEVRAALGNPTRVQVSAQGKTRTLIYESLGLWVSIQLDRQFSFYNTVFDIGIMGAKK
jgi:hypothetical protein